MDRDVAQQLLTKLTAVNTAIQSLATNTSPSNANRTLSEMRSAPVNLDVEPQEENMSDVVAENNPDSEEIETRKDK